MYMREYRAYETAAHVEDDLVIFSHIWQVGTTNRCLTKRSKTTWSIHASRSTSPSATWRKSRMYACSRRIPMFCSWRHSKGARGNG
jgi:hypothetical protein